MYSHALTCPSLRSRSRRGFFWRWTTQHVPSVVWLREIARAALALGNVVLWLALLVALAD